MSRPNTLSYETLNWPQYNKAFKRQSGPAILFDTDMTRATKPTSTETSGAVV